MDRQGALRAARIAFPFKARELIFELAELTGQGSILMPEEKGIRTGIILVFLFQLFD